jgi:hypothetical protein
MQVAPFWHGLFKHVVEKAQLVPENPAKHWQTWRPSELMLQTPPFKHGLLPQALTLTAV